MWLCEDLSRWVRKTSNYSARVSVGLGPSIVKKLLISISLSLKSLSHTTQPRNQQSSLSAGEDGRLKIHVFAFLSCL